MGVSPREFSILRRYLGGEDARRVARAEQVDLAAVQRAGVELSAVERARIIKEQLNDSLSYLRALERRLRTKATGAVAHPTGSASSAKNLVWALATTLSKQREVVERLDAADAQLVAATDEAVELTPSRRAVEDDGGGSD
jgi:hypothetical protein